MFITILCPNIMSKNYRNKKIQNHSPITIIVLKKNPGMIHGKIMKLFKEL